jgi:hypothetical protein
VVAAQFPDMAGRLHIDSGSASLDHAVSMMMGDALANATLRDLAIRSVLPDSKPENMQAAFKVAGRAGLVDLSASYQYVIDDFGAPKTIVIGVPDPLNVRQVDVDVTQVFPRLHVIGADMAASLPFLWDIGVWAEGAYFIPQRLTTVFEADAGSFNDAMVMMGGRYGQQGVIIGYDHPTDEDYLKATAGFDYTFPGGWYLNAQYVRGLPNDNTRDLVENYAFAGLDKPFFYDALKTRLFGGYCFGDDSWILFPQVTWEPYKSVELVLGGLLVFGGLETKLGAFGDDILFTKAKVSFK